MEVQDSIELMQLVSNFGSGTAIVCAGICSRPAISHLIKVILVHSGPQLVDYLKEVLEQKSSRAPPTGDSLETGLKYR